MQSNGPADVSSIAFGAGSLQSFYYFASQSAQLALGPVNDHLLLEEVQDISTSAPLDFAHIRIPEVFSQGQLVSPSRDLLATASFYTEKLGFSESESGGSYICSSSVWEWNSTTLRSDLHSSDYILDGDDWRVLQDIEAAGPVDLEAFEISNIPWLAVANVSLSFACDLHTSNLRDLTVLNSISTGPFTPFIHPSTNGTGQHCRCISLSLLMLQFDGCT